MPEGADAEGAAGRGRAVALALFVTAAMALTLPGLRGCHAPKLTPATQRGPARNLDLTTIDGRPWQLRDYRGEVVVLNLWATWCAPCRSETPTLIRLSQQLGSRGLRVVGVSLDTGTDRGDRVRSFAASYGIPYPLALPDPLTQLDQAVEGVPTTMLFDRQGRLALTYIGAAEERTLRREAESLLAEQ